MDLVCETHVWYEIGSGAIRPADWKKKGHRLLASPLTLIELSSKLRPQSFLARKAAAQAVVDHADEILLDPERHFASIWGLSVSGTSLDGVAGFRAMTLAKDINELHQGVGGMRINTLLAATWRQEFSEQFVTDVEEMIRKLVQPGYAARRKAGRMDYLSDPADIKLLHEVLELPVVVEEQLLVTRTRAAEHAPGTLAPATQEEIDRARPKLLPFVKAYLKYVERLATKHAAEPNDWVDLHFFAYLQDGRVLVTGERRWIEVAREAGLSNLVCELSTFA